MLLLEYTPRFNKDIKRLQKKHVNLADLRHVIRLIATDDVTS